VTGVVIQDTCDTNSHQHHARLNTMPLSAEGGVASTPSRATWLVFVQTVVI
jgi:hypothetical protein